MTQVPYTSKIERPGSSAVSAVYYDGPTAHLYIEFVKQGFMGSIAGYSDVPADIFNKFARAESVGKFYNRVFLGYGFEGYDLPPAPEMVERHPDTPPDDLDVDDVPAGVYQVTVVVDVPFCDSPGEALDAVLRDIQYHVSRAEVKP